MELGASWYGGCWSLGAVRRIKGALTVILFADRVRYVGRSTVSRHTGRAGHVAAGPMLDALSMATLMRRNR